MSGLLIGVLIGWAARWLIEEWVEYQQWPFVFKCPGCGITVRSGNEALVARYAQNHENCEVRP